jgi:hypothetical protein
MGSKDGKLLEPVFLSLCKIIRMGSSNGELLGLLLVTIKVGEAVKPMIKCMSIKV